MASNTRCPCNERASEPLQGLINDCILRCARNPQAAQYLTPLYEDDSECWKYVVYILECAGNCYYVGIECRDKLAKRLSQGPAPPPSPLPKTTPSELSIFIEEQPSNRATEQSQSYARSSSFLRTRTLRTQGPIADSRTLRSCM